MPRTLLTGLGAAATALVGGVLFAAAPLGASGDADATFVPLTPCRLFDTRPGDGQVGPRSAPLGPDERLDVQVTGTNGECSIPTDAVAVSINATAVRATEWSFATFFPSDVDVPNSSSLNYAPGTAPTPNSIDVRLSADGRFSVVNAFGSVHLVGDVTGYYTASTLDAMGEAIAGKADTDDVYTKAEVDALLAANAPTLETDDTYTKAEVDALLAAVAADGYTDAQIDEMLSLKANRDVVYAQHEVDDAIAAAVAGKADAADVYTAAEIDALTQLLYTKDEVDEMVLAERVWPASVDDNGDQLVDGPYTSTRMGAGWYRIVFQLAPYQLPDTVQPVITTNARCSGAAPLLATSPTNLGGTLQLMTIDVATFNLGGVLTDCPIEVMLRLVD
ncbi:MAG: hypothetical protein ACLGHQ_15330 [Acidimicrobiia bacterium]